MVAEMCSAPLLMDWCVRPEVRVEESAAIF
jgi:hypothetical protein